jgi:hypothetical protein
LNKKSNGQKKFISCGRAINNINIIFNCCANIKKNIFKKLSQDKEQKYFIYRVAQNWRTNGAPRCRRDYRKRQKNVKKILLDLFADLEVFECGT